MPIFDVDDLNTQQTSPLFNVALAQSLGFTQLSKSLADSYDNNPPVGSLARIAFLYGFVAGIPIASENLLAPL
jgi:hypothetical protein